MYNCKKSAALVLAVVANCAFADVTAPYLSPSGTLVKITLDSLMGYTLGQKYTFDKCTVDGFYIKQSSDNCGLYMSCTHVYTNQLPHQLSKKWNFHETLKIQAAYDGTVLGVLYETTLSHVKNAADKLAVVQNLISDIESAYGIEFEFKDLTSTSRPNETMLWWCREYTDRSITINYVYDDGTGESYCPGIMEGSVHVQVWSTRKKELCGQQKASQ